MNAENTQDEMWSTVYSNICPDKETLKLTHAMLYEPRSSMLHLPQFLSNQILEQNPGYFLFWHLFL